MKKRTKKPRRVAVYGLRTIDGKRWAGYDAGKLPWVHTDREEAEMMALATGLTVRRIGWLEVKS